MHRAAQNVNEFSPSDANANCRKLQRQCGLAILEKLRFLGMLRLRSRASALSDSAFIKAHQPNGSNSRNGDVYANDWMKQVGVKERIAELRSEQNAKSETKKRESLARATWFLKIFDNQRSREADGPPSTFSKKEVGTPLADRGVKALPLPSGKLPARKKCEENGRNIERSNKWIRQRFMPTADPAHEYHSHSQPPERDMSEIFTSAMESIFAVKRLRRLRRSCSASDWPAWANRPRGRPRVIKAS